MSIMSKDEINVSLFDEVRRLREENKRLNQLIDKMDSCLVKSGKEIIDREEQREDMQFKIDHLSTQTRELTEIGKELFEALIDIWSYIGDETDEFDDYYNLLGRAIELELSDLTIEELNELGVE